ncbi:methyltransferase-like protein 27 [Syngnathus typhle]|uniref:methyltransferase-like protein 27 n=1 Tax=Syngnathus typhle TaxID=161592 RepID=UPI002A6A0F57|nr:methyltransferase-like protein 27 [Syngnathus typhle]XP_061127677.1 methyltransferase-like protein 27 [Syngnathus typhle]XP_061127678.1 methyltransferase-like protein 27 [Syngnathus typhle]XP_061155138.1 methyltransferase-like protein 27 [Syngnathus typhle]XP_061155139.1 methyltransferase-like protein 27 [Syngnathus typhle]XP_061155140.1 methyltransferase-like protein 27 [Syngnathus typhle]
MSADARTFEMARDVVLSLHKATSAEDLVHFYNQWAKTYEQDVELIDYRAPSLAASKVSAHFSGDRQTAAVLDVACGTGMVAKMMKREGFERFVGVDVSEGMLQYARQSGLYQVLEMAKLGDQPLPVPSDAFDVTFIVGGLSSSQIPVRVIREAQQATKQGGYICMTTRANLDNLSYKEDLEGEMKQMEDEGLWRRVDVTVVKEFERGVTDHEIAYIPGSIYVFRKL